MKHAQKDIASNVSKLPKSETSAARRMLSPFEEMDRLFDQLRSREWLSQFHWPERLQTHMPMFAEGRMPKVDVIDRDDAVMIRAELPGVDKKDLDISMTDNSVTLKAETHHEEKEEKGDYYRCEIEQGAYTRTIGLPADVNIDMAKTSFKNGVLELTVPKLERAHRRTIKVE